MGDIETEILDNKKIRRKNDFLLRDVITALAVCHNVTPVVEDGQKIL